MFSFANDHGLDDVRPVWYLILSPYPFLWTMREVAAAAAAEQMCRLRLGSPHHCHRHRHHRHPQPHLRIHPLRILYATSLLYPYIGMATDPEGLIDFVLSKVNIHVSYLNIREGGFRYV